MYNVETLVLGAGISSLYFANIYKGDCCILEKNSDIGGLCRTFYYKDFVWDFAGHFFHFSKPEMKLYFEGKINKNELVTCTKNTKIRYGNLLVDYPFQKNIHQLEKSEFIQCLYDLYFRKEKELYGSFLEMLYGKFGIAITEKFLRPYNEKLYACDLNELDENAMGRFFPYADIEDVIRNMKENNNSSYNNTFDYPKKGAKIFVDILVQDLKNSTIKTNTKVERIDLSNRVVYTTNGTYKYRFLVSTLPFKHFLKFCGEPCEILSANKVLIFNIGFDKEPPFNDVHWIYYPENKYNFYRVGFYNNILGTSKMSIYVEIGFSENESIDIENEYAKTLRGLSEDGIITDQSVVGYNALIINPAYVHISKESVKFVDEKKKTLQNENGVYLCGRYGSWTYCSMEDAMIEAGSIAAILNKDNGVGDINE